MILFCNRCDGRDPELNSVVVDRARQLTLADSARDHEDIVATVIDRDGAHPERSARVGVACGQAIMHGHCVFDRQDILKSALVE